MNQMSRSGFNPVPILISIFSVVGYSKAQELLALPFYCTVQYHMHKRKHCNEQTVDKNLEILFYTRQLASYVPFIWKWLTSILKYLYKELEILLILCFAVAMN